MTSEICANCGRIKGDHYGSLCFCYDDDMTGRADKFKKFHNITEEDLK